MANIIGTAYVNIRALTTKIESDIERSLGPASQRAGEAAGRNISNAVNRAVRDGGLELPSLDTSNAESSISRIRRAVSDLGDNENIEVDIDVNTSSLGSSLNQVSRQTQAAGNQAAQGFISGFAQGNISSYLRRIFYQIIFGTPVIGALIAALSSLGSGFVALASSIGPAVNALAVVPGIVGSAIGAIGTLGLAFGGIGKALSAGSQALTGVGSAGTGAAATMERATNRIADAQADAAKSIEDAHERAAEAILEANQRAAEQLEELNERLIDARERLARVYEDSARTIARAERSVTDAQRDYIDAQQDLLKSQRAINQAREEAADSLVELQFSVEQAAIDEGQAVIALERAREKLAEMVELPPDHRLRREAQLQYDQAALNVEKAQKANEDLAEDQKAAAEAGIEGSAEVVRAKEEQAEAERKVADAQRDVKDAQRELAESHQDSARDIRDAQEDIRDIIEERADIEEERLKTIAEANEDLADTIAETNASLARTLRDAGITMGQAGAAAAGGVDAFAQAMSKLSPEAQEFVRYLLSIRGELDNLRAAAGRELFPKLITALQTLINGGLLDQVARGLQMFGSTIGDTAINLARLTTDPFFQGRFGENIDSTNTVMQSLGDSLVNVTDLLNTVTAAAAPLTEEFAAWIETVTGNWADQARGDFGGLRESILDGGEVVKQLGRIFGNLWDSIVSIGQAARPAGQILLNAFEDATEKLADFLSEPSRQGDFKQYFEDVATNVLALGGLVADLGAEFIKLGDDPSIAKIADILRTEVVPILSTTLTESLDALGPAMAKALGTAAELFAALAESGGVQAFIGTLDGIAQGFLKLTEIPGFGAFIGTFAAFFGTYKALHAVGQIVGVGTLAANLNDLGRVRDFVFANKFVAQTKALQAQAAVTGTSLTTLQAVSTVFNTRFPKIAGGIGKVGDAFKKFGAKAGPVGVVLTIIGALAAAFLATESGQKVLEKLGAVLAKVFDSVMQALEPLWEVLEPALKQLGEAFQPLLDALGQAFGEILVALMPLIESLVDVLAELLLAIVPLLEPLLGIVVLALTPFLEIIKATTPIIADLITELADFLAPIIEEVAGYVEFLTDNLITQIEVFTEWVEGIADAVSDFDGLSGVWEEVQKGWDKGMAWLGDVWDQFTQPFEDAVDFVRTLFQIGTDSRLMATIGKMVVDGFMRGLKQLIRLFEDVWDDIVSALASVIRTIQGRLDSLVGWLKGVPKKSWTALKVIWDILTDMLVARLKTVRERFDGMISFVKGLPKRVRTAVSGLFDRVSDLAANARDWVKTRFDGMIDFVKNLPRRAGTAVGGLFSRISDLAANARDWVKTRFDNMIDRVRDLPSRARSAVSGLFSRISDLAANARDWVKTRFDGMISNVAGLPNRVARAVGGMWDGIKESFRAALNWIVGAWNRFSFSIPPIKAFGKSIGGITVNTPNIPYFAEGGTISATPGGILGIIGEGGRDEVIKPLSGGLSEGERRILNSVSNQAQVPNNITINVHTQPGQDAQAVAREVSRILAFNM